MTIEADMAQALTAPVDRVMIMSRESRWRMGLGARQALAACIGAPGTLELPTSYAGIAIEPAEDIKGWELVR